MTTSHAIVGQPEQVMRLDHLETFIRERGRIGCDLRAHAPGRVRERIVRRDIRELVARAAAERAAGRGQHQRVDGFGRAALEALEDGRVLAVHREQSAAAAAVRRGRQVAGGDEALLVGKCQINSMLERPERGVDAGEPDDGVEHHVRLGRVEQLGEVAARLVVLDAAGLRERAHVGRAGGEGAKLEVRVRVGDLERLAPDRPRRAEERDSLHLLR